MTLDRRGFLQLTAAGMVASLTNSACARDTSDDATATARPDLLVMLGGARVLEIGTRYRAAVPNENTAASLNAAISSSRHRTFPWIGHRSIEERIRDDFADGRTVVVSGWVLSETEARQCALYSLSVYT
jgi:hypothetical protein